MAEDRLDFAAASDYETLIEAIEKGKPYLETRSEIIEYYRDQHGTDWKKYIVDDLQKLDPDRKRESIQREFQYDAAKGHYRYEGKQTYTSKDRYERLGRTLPRRSKTATVTFHGFMYFSKGKAVPANFTRTLDEEQTNAMLDGNFEPLFEAWEHMNTDTIEGIEVTDMTVVF